MEVITIESNVLQKIQERLDTICAFISSIEHSDENDDEQWVDSHDVCQYLKICDRTLQRLRASGKIVYTRIGGKYYYQISQIRKMLKEHLVRSTEEHLQELIDYQRTRGNNRPKK